MGKLSQSLTDPLFLFVQLVGLVGFAFYILSFQKLEPRQTILWQGIGNGIIGLHFIMLASPLMVFYMSFIASARDFGSVFLEGRRQKILLVVYAFFLLLGAALFMRSFAGVLGFLGSCCILASHLCRDRFYLYRALCFLNNALWLFVYITVVSVPGIAFSVFVLVSNAIGVLRYRSVGKDV